MDPGGRSPTSPRYIIIACVGTLRVTPIINAGAAAPVLLPAVLIIARNWGTGPDSRVSVGRLRILALLPGAGRLDPSEDPNDWAAFFTFTHRHHRRRIVRARGAAASRSAGGLQEIERLYQELQAFDRASEAKPRGGTSS
jgi:hypothetical protein